MAWTVVKTYTDAENGVEIEKQHRRRGSRGQTRYLVRISRSKYFTLSLSQLVDLMDAGGDFLDLVDEGKF